MASFKGNLQETTVVIQTAAIFFEHFAYLAQKVDYPAILDIPSGSYHIPIIRKGLHQTPVQHDDEIEIPVGC